MLHTDYHQVLPIEFYNRDPTVVARELLGMWLLCQNQMLTAGIIVEAEAYLATGDPASHAFSKSAKRYKRTSRNAPMFGSPGRAYVYQSHGIHYCFNVVTEAVGVPSAILVRALIPQLGVQVMLTRRGQKPMTDLARGPGNLCKALGIDSKFNGWDLTRGVGLWIETRQQHLTRHHTTTYRIGVSAAKTLPLRFYLGAGESLNYVSGSKKANFPDELMYGGS